MKYTPTAVNETLPIRAEGGKNIFNNKQLLNVYLISPRKGTQEILYPDAPGVFLQDRVKELTPMSTTFTSLTAWIGSESEIVAEK